MIALMTSLLASAQTSVALVILVFSICKKKLELLNLFNIILAFLQEYDAVVLGGRIWVRKGSFIKNWTYFSKALLYFSLTNTDKTLSNRPCKTVFGNEPNAKANPRRCNSL